MKKLFLLLVVLVCVVACSTPASKYEKAIADIVQTNNWGTKIDLNFKVVKMEELRSISVADSIAIITEAFETQKSDRIKTIEKNTALFSDMLEKNKAARYPSQTMINSYESEIARNNLLVDSIKATKPGNLGAYESRKGDDVLAVVVRCAFAYDDPVSGKRAEDTFDFVLSPDGSKCYSKKRVRE